MSKEESKSKKPSAPFTKEQEQRIRELIREEFQKIHEDDFRQSLENA
ncbi:hypothetical protein JET76_28625 [Pseudomonas putida]|nr:MULTISPECIES: hypothetical protein [Pseudomonas]MBI6945266.1 hypothetical protein [Pseudomonas putida]MBI6961578.1 hypothetical protein [Pseudomonas putida]MCZ9636894.1 hypothetical protein [Pseudomonas putida]